MSFLDSYVVQMRDMLNGAAQAPTVVDQATLFYYNRPPGPDYQAPFVYANKNSCPGVETVVEGVEPITFWILIVDEIKKLEDEYDRDRSEFLLYDFSRFDIYGEVLADPELVDKKGQVLRKQKYVKKMCQETEPETGKPYGKPVPFYEPLGNFETFDLSSLYWRHEWRNYFVEQLKIP